MNKSSISPACNDDSFNELVTTITDIVEQSQQAAFHQINSILVKRNWYIGKHIVEFEQQGKHKARYGDKLLVNLSKRLSLSLGHGFSRPNLNNMRKMYLLYPICQTVSDKLSWSHWCEIISLDDELERSFYIKECETQKWSLRTLKRQMNAGLFFQLAKSKDKESILRLASHGHIIQTPNDAVKDTYILEFLGIPQRKKYSESSLEKAIIRHMQMFLLELGKGFAFIGEQYGILIGNTHYRVDLVFYHVILKCYVLIDLKRNAVSHNDIGQMNMYLGYFAKDINRPDDNPPIGIILGHTKDELMIEYATYGMDSQIFISKYQLYLPDREELRRLITDITNN